MYDLNKKIEKITDRDSFISYINLLRIDYSEKAEEWENNDLPSYLEALAGWVNDMDGYYINNNKEIPQNVSWKILAEILTAAKYYE